MSRKRPGVVLNDMQRKFCHEYVIDLNATQAAIRAGYSEDNARSTASHLFDNPDIQDYVDKLQEDAFLRLRITPDEILAELARIAFSEVDDYPDMGFVVTREIARDEGEGRGTREMPIQEDGQLADGRRKSGRDGDCGDASGKQINTDAPVSIGTTAKPRAVLSYRRVVVDPATGSKTTVTFSIQHKIAALRILGLYCGLFVKGKGKFRGDILTIIRPRGRTPEEVESGK